MKKERKEYIEKIGLKYGLSKRESLLVISKLESIFCTNFSRKNLEKTLKEYARK